MTGVTHSEGQIKEDSQVTFYDRPDARVIAEARRSLEAIYLVDRIEIQSAVLSN